MDSERSLCDYFFKDGSPMKLKSVLSLEGDKVLMHGVLHIKVIRCLDLPNVDGVRGMATLGKLAPNFISKDLSDPYVTVHTDDARIAKTRVIDNDLNPVFDETFYVNMAHYCSGLAFKVKDLDMGKTTEMLGKTFLSARELVRFDAEGNPLRVGEHRLVALEGHVLKRGHGLIEYFVEFIPASLLKASPTVPGVYFRPHYDNVCKLYVNADDGIDLAPIVMYGGPDNAENVWESPRLWKDMYEAICDAKHFIYITGWAVDCKQSLLRGRDREEAEATSHYSPVIGELLKQKAEEGVIVNMLVWDDATSNPGMLRPVGFMGTHDEESRLFFKDSKVTFRLAPMQGEKQQFLKEKIAKFVMFTHHQKICVLDAKVEDGGTPQVREPLAFVGGIDLTDGRWDNRHHPLFRTLQTDHLGDCYNGCYPINAAKVGPRQPWHDIHASVRGPAAYDVIANFRERWFKQASDAAGELVDLNSIGMGQPVRHTSAESWCTQVLRSIDERTCVFDKSHLANFTEDDIDGIQNVEFIGDNMREEKKKKGVKGFMKKAQATLEGETKLERRRYFISDNARGFKFCYDLSLKKGRYIDSSMHEGWVHHIRRAEHTLYIESQYFLGGSHMWPSCQTVKCGNLIPAEITLKIIDKIEKGQRFAAYILIPLWPEGVPESASVQAILRWQRFTIEGMYKRISLALRKAGRGSESPRDYLNFYALATRETPEGSTAIDSPSPGTAEDVLSNSRRHQVYVHSKMLIVDDAVTIIGSANINQRSMDGARDSEIGLASFQPAYLPTKESVPNGEVHGFRMHCWATIANCMEDCFRYPSSLTCVRRLNAIAEQNWQKYIAPNTTEMDSHIIPYPIKIDEEGCISPKNEVNGLFPDTKANILGSPARTLPEILTT